MAEWCGGGLTLGPLKTSVTSEGNTCLRPGLSLCFFKVLFIEFLLHLTNDPVELFFLPMWMEGIRRAFWKGGG